MPDTAPVITNRYYPRLGQIVSAEDIRFKKRNLNNKVSNLTDKATPDGIISAQDRKIAFMYDFKGRPSSVAGGLSPLDEPQADPDLIDAWDEITHIVYERKSINFLKSYRRILNDLDLKRHVHEGDATLIENLPAPTGAKITGYHNQIVLFDPPPPPGKISFIGDIKYTDPSNIENSYAMGRIQRNMSDTIDPLTGQPWKAQGTGTSPTNPPNHMKRKKDRNVFWPKAYNEARINEEMAFAFSKINFSNYTPKKDVNGAISTFYKSFATDGKEIEIVFMGGDHTTGILKSIYPSYF